MAFDFTFHPDCMYNLGNSNQFDYNKLFGMGWGLNHHKNSYRIGWRYDVVSGKVEIAHYYYNNGKREFKTILSVELCKTYCVDLEFNRAKNSISVTIIQGQCLLYSGDINYNFDSVSRMGFELYPYFGGDQVAPQEMNITIRKF